ncbi:histidine phosphatase family protein [Sporosarcina limicola]|uniref:Alpha-ribazole phosphatase n=1 Tax=Sporosarcina limicola TaxID=34101 RepID=A0A927MMB3_9BACL|nr:histidine phosphatase family protein [Sporosarcina limicola]MBE1555742.1 alpha-ribazole phosphatase [Sporosarcina limicola]
MADGYHINVVRHLPTAGNKQRKYIGWTDEPIVESAELHRCLAPGQFVYGSDLLRARQTAALYFPKAVYTADWRWRECNFGEFEGRTYADLERDMNYRNWIDDPCMFAPSGGESLRELEARVLSAHLELPNGSIVVTHGGPIRALLTKFSPTVKTFWSWEIPHGSGYRLEWENEQAFKEGTACTSISAVPIMAKETL